MLFGEAMEKRTPKDRKTALQIAFGKTLRKKRLEKNLSQETLADLANLHFTYVSSVERGERNISLENMSKLAKALSCSVGELVLGL